MESLPFKCQFDSYIREVQTVYLEVETPKQKKKGSAVAQQSSINGINPGISKITSGISFGQQNYQTTLSSQSGNQYRGNWTQKRQIYQQTPTAMTNDSQQPIRPSNNTRNATKQTRKCTQKHLKPSASKSSTKNQFNWTQNHSTPLW